MDRLPVVIDSCVLVAALRSKRGASYRLLQSIDSGKFEINLSVPLMLEYEQVCKRLIGEITLTEKEVEDILDYVCQEARHRIIFYLWRPFLPDPQDDMVLELAVAASCERIVSYNLRDFRGAEHFGVRVLTPKEFLIDIGELS